MGSPSNLQLSASKVLSRVGDFLRLTAYKVRYPLQNPKTPGLSAELDLVDVYRRDAAAGLLHLRMTDREPAERHRLYFVRQFRFSTTINSETGEPDLSRTGLLTELMAGTCQAGEPPLETFRRETREETGFELEHVEHIGSFYPSPGACSERVHLYYGRISGGAELEDIIDNPDNAYGGYDEYEEVKRMPMSPEEFLLGVENKQFLDGKALAAAEWLRRDSSRKHFD